jgi:hypothetical protein
MAACREGRLITDVAVSPTGDTDARWDKLTLTEVRDVLGWPPPDSHRRHSGW